MLSIATRVAEDFSHVLSSLDRTAYGYPESKLPHSKDRIREALALLLENVGDHAVAESLAQAYVYLAQFVPDADAALIQRSQDLLSGDAQAASDGAGYDDAATAMRKINDIKLAMERAVEEVREIRSKG